MKELIKPVKGTRDFYPENMRVRTWLFSNVRNVSELYGYQEYEGPFLELLELYAAKSGEELVKEQSFVFPDRSGELIALRPELTPTLARMVAQRQKQLNYPLRWWSFGPFWRYERPQKGRAREFFQWNIDLIGVNSTEADAEIIAIVANFFTSIGLTSDHVKIFINDRHLVEMELNKLGIFQDQFTQIFRLIDRKEKLSQPNWLSYAQELKLETNQVDGIITLLSDTMLWEKSKNLTHLFLNLDAMNVVNFVQFDPKIIRGLDYYTSTVFEAKEIQGNIKRSILGGGRYDNLLEDVGGDPLPAVGFAMGDIVISLICDNLNLLPANLSYPPAQVMVTVFNQELSKESLIACQHLRLAGINTILYPEIAPLSRQFKFASKIGMKYAIVIGPDETQKGVVAIKELATGIQKDYVKEELLSAIRIFLDM